MLRFLFSCKKWTYIPGGVRCLYNSKKTSLNPCGLWNCELLDLSWFEEEGGGEGGML